MRLGRILVGFAGLVASALYFCRLAPAQSTPAPPATSSPSSSSAKHVKKPVAPADSGLDAGTVTKGLYRNKTLALTCKVPDGWVLRTEEMNVREDETESSANAEPAASSAGAKVLLAAFSRPPAAQGEEVNSSIMIAAESAASYPGLKDAAQYLGPVTEVAKAQEFTMDEDPYEISVSGKTLARGDFHKNVGSRVMHQTTLAMLSHGYAISITLIAGTDDEIEDLVDGLSFSNNGK